ncbi:MAG: Rrf2 family transcriptional regulator [Akkermansiaceae bacterium]|nr:Rrf2 family transcriptional regulator [Akkermansiaceae bacterium]
MSLGKQQLFSYIYRILQIGKIAQNAISAVSYLIERRRCGHDNVGSQEVADARNLSKPPAAKIHTTLSKIGIVTEPTGPGGGYRLAKPAADIFLLDVVSPFELQNKVMTCPFGGGWYGNHEPLPTP